MRNRNLFGEIGLKWNPFDKNLPIDGIVVNKDHEEFCWRIENLVMDGGFAMITGRPGTGKSVRLRLLEKRLSSIPEVKIAAIDRPQSALKDFYQELGSLFDIDLKPNNRWKGFKELRTKWSNHIKTTMFRSVLIIDECQEMPIATLNEIRLLSSTNFDSKNILTVVLSGDERLLEKLKNEELVPLNSRISVRLNVVNNDKKELALILRGVIEQAGNSSLMTDELINILADHSMGNLRAMMIMANDLLLDGIRQNKFPLDQQSFFDKYNPAKISRSKR